MEYTEEQKADIQKQIEEATKGLLNQEQIDAIVSKRVKDLSDKHAKDLEEKEKIAKMTADEKIKHELEQYKTQLAEKDSLLAQKEHKEKLSALMGEKKVSNEFFDMFANVTDLEKAGALMDKFNESFTAKLNTEIDNKITPHAPSKQTNSSDYAEIDAVLGIRPTA